MEFCLEKSCHYCQACHNMMSRFYYVLYLLIAIKWSFCYDYIHDNKFKYKYEQSPTGKGRVHRAKSSFESRRTMHKRQPDYETLGNKEAVTQIDVNSFIQKPDEYAIGDNLLNNIDIRKSKAKSKKYDEYRALSDMNMAEDINSNKFQYVDPAKDTPDINQLYYKDIMNSQYSNYYPSMHSSIINKKGRKSETKPSSQFEMFSIDSKVFHKPQKKSPFKFMKIPFFSHSKNETQKAKKDKKRKMLCFNCPKKENKLNETPIEGVKDAMKKDETENLNVLPTIKEGSDNNQNSIKNARKKRDEWMVDRERQLKELEDIQRKVDGVEIASPSSRPNE